MPKQIRARIKFLPASEGGFSRPPPPGVRPQLRVGEILTSCVVRPMATSDRMELGKEYDVTIEVLFWDQYGHLFTDEMEVELHDGSRVVGRGRFLESARRANAP